ncbi:hypothetical protein ACFQ3Z_45935 [Streptomyces nogalater]
MTKLPLAGSPTSTWNDQAQSALAFAEPVPLPVFTTPRPARRPRTAASPSRARPLPMCSRCCSGTAPGRWGPAGQGRHVGVHPGHRLAARAARPRRRGRA